MPNYHEFTDGSGWHTGAILIRDSWDTPGYRIYEAPSPDADYCVQVDGEVNGPVFRTIREAREYCQRRFPGIRTVRR